MFASLREANPSLRMTGAQSLEEPSGDLSFGQFSYQLPIGFQEIERRQIRSRSPPHIFKNSVLDFAFVLANCIEAQFDCRPILIFVPNPRHLFPNGRVDAEFFIQFPVQRGARLLALFNLSARKFPFERHGLMAGALADQNLVILENQVCDHLLYGWRRGALRTACRFGLAGSGPAILVFLTAHPASFSSCLPTR